MCGIVGIFSKTEKGKLLFDKTPDAIETLKRRGPNSGGIFKGNRAWLGHRRLSIIDTHHRADQPMKDPSGRYVLIYNGEIFNYQEIKKDLSAKGILFETSSDTEVLLHLLIQEGKEGLNKLNGFFAFAFYDTHYDTVLLARDRFGVKPLVYGFTDDFFAFASEIKALKPFGLGKKINKAAVFQFLQLNYIAAPQSIYQDIFKVEPGAWVYLQNGEITFGKYYELPKSKVSISYQDAQMQLYKLLDDAVERRMVADVPLGCFLSGGIDSSVITALAAQKTKQLHTFSIGFKDEPFFDETHYALQVAEKWKTQHTVFSLSNDELFAQVFEALDYFDEPFADSSALAVYILSNRTAKQVKVVLSGDGADELFAGYYKHMAHFKILHPGFAGKALMSSAHLLQALKGSRNSTIGHIVRRMKRFASAAQLSPQDRFWAWSSIASANEAKQTLVDGYLDTSDLFEFEEQKLKFVKNLNSDDIRQVMEADLQLVLPNDMLMKVDSMSMANSLEVRNPFLDYRVVEFAQGLPENYKINAHIKKRIVQDAFREILPTSLYNRPKKGFELPLLNWLRNDLKSLLENRYLEKPFLIEQGIFDPLYIDQLWNSLFSRQPGDAATRLWGILVFQHWYIHSFLRQ